MGLKQRRIQTNKKMRKISLDRESIYNKFLNTQKSFKDDVFTAGIDEAIQEQIEEDEAEHLESEKLELDNTDADISEQKRNSIDLDLFLFEPGSVQDGSATLTKDNNLGKSSKFFADDIRLRTKKNSIAFHKRSVSGTVFNNNKFSMAVKIDNVTKDKKDLKVFMKHLKNRIVTPEQFKNLFMIKSEIILFETNLDNLCSISKENEKRRKDQIHEFTKDILSIDLSLDG